MPAAMHVNMLAASPPMPPVRHRSKSHSVRAPPHLLRPCAEPGGSRSDSPDLIERTVDFLFRGARADKEPFGCALPAYNSQQYGASLGSLQRETLQFLHLVIRLSTVDNC